MECKTGIYLITHIESGKVYVGLTGVGFKHRWNEHRLRLNSKKSSHYVKLQHAWNKYGESAFSFSIHTKIDKVELNDDEFYSLLRQSEVGVLRVFPNNYNSTDAGISGMAVSSEVRKKISKSHMGMKHSDASKAKIKAAVKIQRETTDFIERAAKANIGRKLSTKHIEAIRKSNIGNQHTLGKKHSDETKAKMSAAHQGRKYSLGHKWSEEQRERHKKTIKESWVYRKAKK